MRYNLTSLEVFVATAEERNLTRAATRCHLASSAVSKRISELEEQVGAPLLVRYARGVGLTPAGQSMLHHARQVLQTMQRMDDELSEYASGIKGHVRIHAVTSALAQFLPADLAAFMHRYPLIRLDIEERVGAAIIRAVADGRADVGVFASQTPSQGLQTFPYKNDELVIAVSRAHPLSSVKSIAFREALQYEFVGPHFESSLHALIEKEAKKLGLPVAQRTRVSSFDCMCRMVAENLGIAILPANILKSYMSFLDIRCVRLEEEWVSRSLVIGSRDFDSLPYTARALIDQLTQLKSSDASST
jgi:DNA-binding transcriptional LysR family regulator